MTKVIKYLGFVIAIVGGLLYVVKNHCFSIWSFVYDTSFNHPFGSTEGALKRYKQSATAVHGYEFSVTRGRTEVRYG